jgi:hypothetical protein
MRFFDVLAALDYIENADPVCSACGAQFTRASIHSITSTGGGWMLRFPHDCRVKMTTPVFEGLALSAA